MIQMNKLTKQKQLTDTEKKFMITKRDRGWGKDKSGVWDQQIQTATCKTEDNTVLLCNTGKYSPYLAVNHNGKEYVYKCITEPLSSTPDTNTTLQISYTSVKNT